MKKYTVTGKVINLDTGAEYILEGVTLTHNNYAYEGNGLMLQESENMVTIQEIKTTEGKGNYKKVTSAIKDILKNYEYVKE